MRTFHALWLESQNWRVSADWPSAKWKSSHWGHFYSVSKEQKEHRRTACFQRENFRNIFIDVFRWYLTIFEFSERNVSVVIMSGEIGDGIGVETYKVRIIMF